MNRLFVSLYFDEDVDVLVAKLIASRNFSVATTVVTGRLHSTDAEQLAYAAQNELAIVTHNRDDFEKLARQYLEEGRKHFGIIVAIRRPPYEIARRLLALLNRVTAEEMENQLLYV